MKKYLIFLVCFVSYAFSDVYIYGDIDSSGSIDMYDNDGNYYYSDVDQWIKEDLIK